MINFVNDNKKSRFLYILEAAFEYFISILIVGAYLAKLTSAIGLSDNITGILTAFVSLGCAFQIAALFLVNRKPVKKWVTILHVLNQLCFTFVYIVPVMQLSQTAKATIFVTLLLLGYIISNMINSPKINWFMNGIGESGRGVFTAKKEIISLVGGMVFSYLMGAVIDNYEAKGQINTAFIIGAIVIFILTALHTLTLIFNKEKVDVDAVTEKVAVKKSISALIKNKSVMKIIALTVLWYVASYATTPFYGTYQIKELGFSMVFLSALSMVYAVVRSAFSVGLGKFADKKSFSSMLNICYIIAAASFFVNIFTVPANGKVMFTIHYVLFAISQAGINSGTINLIYSKVEYSQRMGAYALQQCLSGGIGFITTLLVSMLVDHIQNNGNTLFGLSVYAQQIVSIIGCVVTITIIIYLNCSLIPPKQKTP